MRLIFKDFPLPAHDLARPAHEAARCAAAAGQYWAYHDRLFAEQPGFERSKLIRYAVELGLDAQAFTRCLDTPEIKQAVEADLRQARALRISETPSFLINGGLLVGAHPIEAFRAAIDDALRRVGGKK